MEKWCALSTKSAWEEIQKLVYFDMSDVATDVLVTARDISETSVNLLPRIPLRCSLIVLVCRRLRRATRTKWLACASLTEPLSHARQTTWLRWALTFLIGQAFLSFDRVFFVCFLGHGSLWVLFAAFFYKSQLRNCVCKCSIGINSF